MTSKIRLCNIAKVGLLLVGHALSSLRMRKTPGCSYNHKRNMFEINCSTLQFCTHGAYIDHMYLIHDKSTCVYIGILNWYAEVFIGL